jgi:hypothetical protein
MAKASATPRWQRALIVLTGTVVAVVVVSCLYWAQTVLVPVALAVFLSFLLTHSSVSSNGGACGEHPRWSWSYC